MAYVSDLGSTLTPANDPGATALARPSPLDGLLAFLRQIAPVLLLLALGYIIWKATKGGRRARRANPRANPKALGGWSRHQEAATRRRHLSQLVNEDGYATVARRLTLLKNVSRGAKKVVDTDLDWLRGTYGG